MKFHDKAKKNLFRFAWDITLHCNILEIKEYIDFMKQYNSFDTYFSNVIDHIDDSKSEGKYDAKSTLAIVAGLYYGRDLSLKHLERDYDLKMPREQLKQEVITFTSHVLFGEEASGVTSVGDLQIEKEGLVPIMDRIIASGMTEQEQKNELMKYLNVYGVLSERAMQEAREAADRDPDMILARNTYQNRNGATSAAISFVEMVGGSKKPDSGKSVAFFAGLSK